MNIQLVFFSLFLYIFHLFHVRVFVLLYSSGCKLNNNKDNNNYSNSDGNDMKKTLRSIAFNKWNKYIFSVNVSVVWVRWCVCVYWCLNGGNSLLKFNQIKLYMCWTNTVRLIVPSKIWKTTQHNNSAKHKNVYLKVHTHAHTRNWLIYKQTTSVIIY